MIKYTKKWADDFLLWLEEEQKSKHMFIIAIIQLVLTSFSGGLIVGFMVWGIEK